MIVQSEYYYYKLEGGEKEKGWPISESHIRICKRLHLLCGRATEAAELLSLLADDSLCIKNLGHLHSSYFGD